MTFRRRGALAAGLAFMLTAHFPAMAQPYPSRLVKVVVSHAAGRIRACNIGTLSNRD